jgi:hypothetical protein
MHTPEKPVNREQTESMAILATNVAVCAIAFRDQLLGGTAVIPGICQEMEFSLETLGDEVGAARIVARSVAD